MAVRLVFVDSAGLRGLVQKAADAREELGCVFFLAASDCCTDLLEFAFDDALRLAVAGCAADGLACAFCG